MRTTIFISALFLFCLTYTQAQNDDYLGAGNNNLVTVTSSSGAQNAPKTFDGDGLFVEKAAAARFLSHATFGADMITVNAMVNTDFETWIDQQAAIPASNYLMEIEDIWNYIYTEYMNAGYTEDQIFGPSHPTFSYTWHEHLMTEPDQLRQKISYVLSQIMVISINSDLRDWGYALASYYDVFQEHGLGNFKDLLLGVTLHPSMGFYLSHFENPKTNIVSNRNPDENYAREIMQLFSIGLYELNNNGTFKLDGSGERIPTYDNNDIKELAKVFTGLGAGGIQPWVDWTGGQPVWNLGIYNTDRTVPMLMYDAEHEPGPKVLLGGAHTIDGTGTGMEEVEEAVDFLFNHPNVGPFLAKKMIQRMIKSNPSPHYINRVATKFNNNGQGVRGDMLAVVKAILLDEEARSCYGMEGKKPGRLREPVMRYASLLKAFPLTLDGGNFWETGIKNSESMGQQVLNSPTVFNFYLPDYQPNGQILELDMVAPEFQIFNTQTSIGYINQVNNWTLWDYILYDWEEDDVFGDNTVHLDDNYLINQLENNGIEKFLNDTDILLAYGQLSDDTRDLIRQAALDLNWDTISDARVMLYILMISPDYSILK